MNKAVFLDKDGTLLHDVPYNVDPDLLILHDGALEALTLLKRHGYLLIVVSNQSGIARGYFTEDEFQRVIKTIDRELSDAGLALDGFYFCPHHPEGKKVKYRVACDCRKPQAGMFTRAAQNHLIDLSQSWMIGDILDDVQAGNTAGCRTILINNGNETLWQKGIHRHPTFTVNSILEAAHVIVLGNRKPPVYERRYAKNY